MTTYLSSQLLFQEKSQKKGGFWPKYFFKKVFSKKFFYSFLITTKVLSYPKGIFLVTHLRGQDSTFVAKKKKGHSCQRRHIRHCILKRGQCLVTLLQESKKCLIIDLIKVFSSESPPIKRLFNCIHAHWEWFYGSLVRQRLITFGLLNS